MESKVIAIDFDGTIVEDVYPKIGKPKFFAFETLKKLQQDGHRLILWTYRHGAALQEAVIFCQKNGIVFYAVNQEFEGEDFDPKYASRKIYADLFVDDRNLGGFPGWGEVYQIITNGIPLTLERTFYEVPKKKKGFFRF
ncbi:MAG: BT0820 family HAD-type phosphatase [Flavobacteriales bacterium AspAUS03]